MQLTEEDVVSPKVEVKPEVKAAEKAKADVVLTVDLRKQHKVEFDFGALWNVNEWSLDTNSDKYCIRASSLIQWDLDINGLAKTHLRDNNIPFIEGYSDFTHNRTQLHRRAKVGSSGVCILIKLYILFQFTIKILDNDIDEILWVELVYKTTSEQFCICVCYLPPEGSSRNVDPRGFFDSLLS